MEQQNDMNDVIVIGAGAIGISIAAALMEAGLQVVVLERGCVGAEGATRYSGGIVRQMDLDPVRSRLSAAASPWQQSWVVRDAFNASTKRTGVIHLGSTAQCTDLLASASYGVTAACDASMAIGPFLSSSVDKNLCALVEYAGGIADVRGYVARLADYVRSEGTLHDHLPVARYGADAEQAYIDAGGLTLRARIVIDACGADAPAGRPTGLVHARTIPFTRFSSDQVPGRPLIAYAVNTYVLPLTSTTMQVGGQIRSTGASVSELDTNPYDNETDACNRLSMLGFSASGLTALGTKVAFDAYTNDGLPVIGFADPLARLYLATGFCGVGYKMAPTVAELVTADVLRRLKDCPLEPAQRDLLRICAPGRRALQGAQ